MRQWPEPPYGRWFPNWKTNISYNALDRHVSGPRKNKVAYYWEGEERRKTENLLTMSFTRKSTNSLLHSRNSA